MNESHELDLMMREIHERARDALDRIMANREKIIEAFIAETGCLPSEIEQVEVLEGDAVRWFLRRRETVEATLARPVTGGAYGKLRLPSAEPGGNSGGNRGVNEPGA